MRLFPGLSARAYDRILKASRIIADFGTSEEICLPLVAEQTRVRSICRD